MLNRPWFRMISAYVFWIVALALALWVLVLLRNTVPLLITNLVVQNPAHARNINIIVDRILVLGGGIGWLVFMGLIENDFRKSTAKPNFWRRIARVLGVLLVVIFVLDAGQVIQYGPGLTLLSGWLLLAVELGLGTALIIASREHAPAGDMTAS